METTSIRSQGVFPLPNGHGLSHPMITATVIIVVTLCAVVFLLFWSKSRRQPIRSFWDAVRHAEALPDLNEFRRQIDDAAASLSDSSTRIAQLVDRFVFESPSTSESWTDLRVLAKLGAKAYPRALEILRDPSLKERLTRLTQSEQSLPEGPINRLCELFDQDAPPPKQVATLLAPFLTADSDEIRKSVAVVIGSIGSSDSLPLLRRSLTDEDEYVRSYALMGIKRAISGNRIEESSKDEFFQLVAGMWPEDTSMVVAEGIPPVLLELDRERAIQYLLSDKLFSVSFPPLCRILEALQDASVEVPRDRVLTIISDASAGQIEYPMGSVLEHALPLLAAHQNPDDLEMLERFLDDEHEEITRGAAEALYRFHGFGDRIRDPWEVIQQRGWDALTEVERHICAVEQLDAEVNNGGFAQYYFNCAGDHWRDAQDGLQAIGAVKRYRLLAATLNRFRSAQPATNVDKRRRELSKIARLYDDPFEEQDNAWYDLKDENLDRLILKYSLANLEGRYNTGTTDE